jgi:hypothetical protein
MKESRLVLSRLISYSTKKIVNCISAKRKEKHFYFQQLECNGMTWYFLGIFYANVSYSIAVHQSSNSYTLQAISRTQILKTFESAS